MKHIKLASAAALIMGVALAGTVSAQTAASGTITFTGSVGDGTCTISGGSGASGTGNFTVALDQALPADLATAGAVAKPHPFSVVIGGPGQSSCVDGKVATMTFLVSSPQIDASTGALRNALGGQATNVQIQLRDSRGVINLADPTYSVNSPAIADNTATIPFTAQYLAVGGAATPGEVSTSVVYGINYN